MREEIDKFQKVERVLSESRGGFELFALVLREESPDKWDLLISSDWARENQKASINRVFKELRKELNDRELLMLSGIIILDEKDTLLNAIPHNMQVEHGLVEISNGNFLGLPIEHAYIITYQNEVHDDAVPAEAKI